MNWNLEEALSYYKKQGAPSDQNALISLLKEIQYESNGSIPLECLGVIATAYGIKESYLQALIKRIPSLRMGDTHCLELCAGPNCGKHSALAKFAEELQKNSEKRFVLKYIQCMRMCGKGPNIKWDGVVYHQADEKLLEKLVSNVK